MIFSRWTKFMFGYIKGCIPGKFNRLFTFNYDIRSNITRSSEELHTPKGNATRSGINTLSFDGAKT